MRKDEKAYNQFGLSLYDDVSATPVSLKQVADNYLDAGEGAIGDTENPEQTIQFIAEIEIGEEVLLGALQGDFNDDPTFWSDVGQIVTGLIPIAGQLGDARDSIHALDDITNQEGYKKLGSWATLFLIVIGFVPGVGDAIKSVGRRGIRYLDNNRITKRIGEWLGDNIISPILERVGDLTAPLVGQIKDGIRRKLAEAQEIARQLGEGVDNIIDDVTGRPQVATEGAGNVPVRMETDPPIRGNEPSRMEGNQSSGSSPIPSPPSGMSDKLIDIRSTLKDPRAVEAFDNKFAKMRGNSKAMEGAMEGMRRSGSDIEARMLEDWKKANPTPKGAGLSLVPDALARGQKLRDEVQAFKDANSHIKGEGFKEWFKGIDAELRNLEEMQKGVQEAKTSKVEGSVNNIKSVETELYIAKTQPGVTGIGQKMILDGIPKKVDVDVVADYDKTWIEVKDVKPFGLGSSNWRGDKGKDGLRSQIEDLLKSASQNLHEGEIPKVAIEFPQGVTREVSEELRKMGVEVRGNVVDFP